MLTSSNADPAFAKNGFYLEKCNGEEHFKSTNRLISIRKKQEFLSDLTTHIARFPDGEFFRQLAHG